MHLLCNFVNVYTKLVKRLVNVYMNMADNNKTLMILSYYNITASNVRSRL